MKTQTHTFSIRAKTTLFVIAALGILVGLVAGISAFSSHARIETIEDDRALEELDRVSRQLDNSIGDLGGTNADWAWWDDSYTFLQDGNQEFVDNNLYAEAFTPIGIDLFAYIDTDGNVISDAWYTDDGEQAVPEGLLDYARPGGEFADFASDTAAAPGGIVNVDGSVFLATVRAVIRSDFSGVPTGTLLMARAINADFAAELATLTGLDLQLTGCEAGVCGEQSSRPLISKTAEQISATGNINANDGTPALHLRIDGPRTMYRQSVEGIQTVLLAMLAVGALAVVFTIAGLRGLVVRPLENLGVTVADVGRTNNMSIRADVDRHDEIGVLASDLNVMLSRLERSQNELVAAKQQIEGASAAKSKFLARVSHEVRTPLNGVLAYAQLLQLDDLDSESGESVDQIIVAARHITDLVDEFLDIARIEAGTIPLSIDVVDPLALANEVIALTQPVAAENETSVTIARAETTAVLADPLRLRQVLLNLVSNAIKYGGTTRPIEVTCTIHGDRTHIVVRDYGPGIAPDQLHRLFVPFDRLDADGGTKSGTGLGLSVTKQLVELMDGNIEAESELGSGSAFIISLPRPPRLEAISEPASAVTGALSA